MKPINKGKMTKKKVVKILRVLQKPKKSKNIDKLKQVIQEANPEIMELKMGCRVEVKAYLGESIYINEVTDNGGKIHFNPTTTYFLKNDIEGAITVGKIDKILGRPIHLADVFIAMDGRNMSRFMCESKWDLTKDLDHQLDPTKQFLIDLLTKTND